MGSSFDTITVVGAGKMGSAMVSGWLSQGVPSTSIVLIDPVLRLGGEAAKGWAAQGFTTAVSARDLPDCTP